MKFSDRIPRERSIDGQRVRTQYKQRIVQVTPVRPDYVAVFENQDGSEYRRLIIALALVETDTGDTVQTSVEGMTFGEGCAAECVSDNGHFRGYEFVEEQPSQSADEPHRAVLDIALAIQGVSVRGPK